VQHAPERARIVADDPGVAERLEALQDLVLAEGGYIHPALTIKCAGGEFCIESALSPDDRRVVIFVPEACLPDTHAFDVSVNGDRFVWSPRHAGIGETRLRAFGLMMDLYDLTGKAAAHRARLPWLAFAPESPVLDLLDAARPGGTDALARVRRGEADAVLVDTFFRSRVNRSDDSQASLLMPFIDFANHHSAAGPVLRGELRGDGRRGLGIANSRPEAASADCRFCYGQRDALDFLVCYGFADRTATVVQSVPFRVDVPGIGRLQVYSMPFAGNCCPAARLPEALSDLHLFYPRTFTGDDGVLRVAYLLVPPAGAPRALRRVIESLLREAAVARGADVAAAVAAIEHKLLKVNDRFFDRLAEDAERPAPATAGAAAAAVRQLARQQRARLAAYRENAAALPWTFLSRAAG